MDYGTSIMDYRQMAYNVFVITAHVDSRGYYIVYANVIFHCILTKSKWFLYVYFVSPFINMDQL